MSGTTRFREQHIELQQLVHSEILKNNNFASETRMILTKLINKILMHITIEDRVLYPMLMSEEQNQEVKNIAEKYSSEMKTTSKVLFLYNKKWKTTDLIQKQAYQFVQETREIISVLKKRIDRENLELYVVADKAGFKYF